MIETDLVLSDQRHRAEVLREQLAGACEASGRALPPSGYREIGFGR